MSDSSIETEVIVIGAGVIGLAIARELSQRFDVIVVESNPQFGQETSSRNSEVIHSGIYYPAASQKTKFCLRGRELLYDFLKKRDIPHAKVGKYLVATEHAELAYLEKMAKHCDAVGAPYRWAERVAVERDEPGIIVDRAIFFPETGIVDSHQFMATLEHDAAANDAMFAYRHVVKGITREGDRWKLLLKSPDGEVSCLAPVVVNAAGLAAATLANLAEQGKKFEHRFCRGRYFQLNGKYRNRFKRLVYPVPPKDGAGIHITIDLSGNARLGPDVDWLKPGEMKPYDCDWEALRPSFGAAARRYCPSIDEKDLEPGLIGIRAKLFQDGVATPDFVLHSYEHFHSCLGIESPGLTASLALAEAVAKNL